MMNTEKRDRDILPTDTYIIASSTLGLKGCSLILKRDSDYRIRFTLECSRAQFRDYKNALKSKRRKTRIICRGIYPHKRIFIPQLFVGSETLRATTVVLSGEVVDFFQYDNPRPRGTAGKEFCLYYFLNSPNNFPFPRVIEYKTRTRTSQRIDGFVEESYVKAENSGSSTGGIILRYKDTRVAIVKVEDKDSGFFGMFVRTEYGAQIGYEDVSQIMAIFGFLTGTTLFYLGYAKIQNFEFKHKQYHRSTLQTGIAGKLDGGSHYPLPYGYSAFRPGHDPTEDIQNLLDGYLSLRSSFKLDDVLALVQIARHTTFELRIQPLATAYDILKSCWFNSDKSQSKGKYVDDTKYRKTMENYIPQIRKELGEGKRIELILSNILKANEASLGKKDQILFEELGLQYGEVERFAFRTRSRVIHGGFAKSVAIARFANQAYETILNRLIMHLLGGPGYIDYTTSEQSIRATECALGGPADDGRVPNFEASR